MPPIAIRQTDLARDPVSGLFALIGVVPSAVARPLEGRFRLAQQQIVFGEGEHIIAHVSDRGIEPGGVIGTAAVLAAGVVNDAVVAQYKRGIERFVAQFFPRGPAVERGLRDPEPIGAEVARLRRVAPAHEALARGRIARENRCRPRGSIIRCLDMKGEHRAAGLARNRAAEQARAVIGHRDNDHVGRGVNAIFQKQRCQAVGIVHARRHCDGLIRRRQNRAVSHVGDGRAGVGQSGAVARSRGAGIPRGENISGRFEPVAMQPEQDLGPAAQPADLCPDGCGLTRVQRGLESRADPVGAGVAVAGRAHVQTTGAVVALADLDAGVFVIALRHPAGNARFKIRIGNQVRASRREHFDIVHQTFAGAEQDDLQRICGAVAVVEHARVLDRCPGALVGLVAVGPVGRQPTVSDRIDPFQTAASAMGPFAPASALSEGHVVHDNVNNIGHHLPGCVGADDLVRHRQRNVLAAVGQTAVEIAERVCAGQVWVVRQQPRGIFPNDEIAIRGNGRAGRESVFDAAGEAPPAHIHSARGAIVQLDKFIVALAAERVIQDLIDNDVRNATASVGRSRRFRLQPVKSRRSIRRTPGRNAILLPAETDGVDHARVGGVLEINRFAGRV